MKLMDEGQCGTTKAKQTPEQELRNAIKGTDLPDVMSTFNLYAYSKYRFFVTATNTAYESATLYIDTITPERKPESEPQHVELSDATETSLSFSWDVLPCKESNGDIIRYEYVIQVLEDSGQYKTVSTGGINVPTCLVTIGNLTCGRDYRFEVAGTNSAGTGPYAKLDATTLTRPPGAVQSLSAYAATPYECNVTWQIPADIGCPEGILTYDVRYEITGSNSCGGEDYPSVNETLTGIRNTSVIIRGFQPFPVYVVFVMARNGEVIGQPEMKTLLTNKSAPGTVRELRVNALSSSDLNITWKAPSYQGCPIELITYDVKYYVIDKASCAKTKSFAANNGTVTEVITTNVTISGLYPNSTYAVIVTAKTDVTGKSVMKNGSTFASGPSVVEMLQGVPFSSSISLSWHPPYVQGCPFEILWYRLNYRLIGSGTCGVEDTSTQISGWMLGHEYNIQNLIPYSTYIITVWSHNRVSVGDLKEKRITTAQSEPGGPPREVRLVLASSTSHSMQFKWKQPLCKERNGIITNYTYLLTNSRTADQTGTIVETSYNFTDLTPYVNYTFTVAASTIVGMGPYSDDVVGMTKEDKPPPPTDLGVLDKYTTNTSITVTWNEPDPPHGIIDRYLVRYWKDGGNSSTVIVTSTMAKIDNLQPYANYSFKVRAFTGAGKGPLSVATSAKTKEGRPLAPSNLKMVNSTNTSITITWTKPYPTLGVEKHYQIMIWNKEDRLTINMKDSNETRIENVTEAVLEGLQANRDYYVKVRAFTTIGAGNWTDIIIAGTKEGIPTGPPVNVTLRTSLKRMLAFQWGLPNRNERSGIIIGYQYRFTNMRTGLPEMNTVNGTEKAFEGLTPYVNYTFEVGAMTKIGIGPYSRAVIARTLEARPPAPDNITFVYANSTSVTIAWPEPNPPRGIITKYDIEYWKKTKNDSANWTNNVTVTSVFTHTTIDELDSDTNYTIKVRAHTITGEGTWSKNITINTQEGIPAGPPVNVTLTTSLKRKLAFQWAPPRRNERNGIIIGYQYKFTNMRTGLADINTVNGTENAFEELTPFVNYTLEVGAMTKIGIGPYSRPVITRTLEAIPPAPEELAASNTDITSITIQWLEPDPPHGVIIRYHIQYWMTSESMSTAMSAMNDAPTFTLSGLQPNDEYSFRVQAETSTGRGNWSSNVTAEAQEGLPSAPSDLQAIGFGKTSIVLEWRKCTNPNGLIQDYAIKYQALEKAYNAYFISDDSYITLKVPTTAADDVIQYLVDDLEPSTKYEFRVSGRTSAGRGEEAIIEVYTKIFTDIIPPGPPVLKTSGPSVIIKFDVLPTYVSNVFVAVEYVPSRNKRQNSNLDGASNSFIVANLTRNDIEEGMTFTLGDNKTYGGYINHVLIAGATYTVRVAYASCTPVEECVVVWSPISIITVPDCTNDHCGETWIIAHIGAAAIGGSLGAIAIIVIVIIIVAIVICHRSQTSPSKKSPTPNETYDEIDPQIGQKSGIQSKSGYKVNLAMEGLQTPKQYEGDESYYEDVNTKRESDYQGLNTGDMETEHDYQGLGETEKKKESDYQGLSEASVGEEHVYQGLV
ncbi:phosphatidylinositol phosphatase PTPRQ-like [Amphiura filiformis]|uniref:phosphatidylinositol phosphatase PTPRQ-like n=1 Tax=Amphiura filiformis TaxID=82378 RepID=UPI003B22278C